MHTSFFLFLLLLSCVNTSYSTQDEKQIDGALADIILGQFPHRGEAFYKSELDRTEELLKINFKDFEARNDRAVAYLKLKEWDRAQKEFALNEKLHPGKYETAANLGVLYKKLRSFELAERYIKRSLEIKPEGHMGLGDYYLKMIQWQISDKTSNFLGISYKDYPYKTASIAKKDYVVTLIKNDRSFADAYYVLGDILVNESQHALAFRAYKRAESLNPQVYRSLVRYRLQNVFEFYDYLLPFWKVFDSEKMSLDSQYEFKQAEVWLQSFERIEEELLKAGKIISFENIIREMEARSFLKVQINGSVGTLGLNVTPQNTILMIFSCIVALFTFCIFKVYKGTRQMKAMRLRLEAQKRAILQEFNA